MGQRLLDQYSLLHYAVGVVAYFWGFGFISAIVLHTIFEWAENTPTGIRFINDRLHGIWPGGKPKTDTLTNCVGDTITFGLGWACANLLDKHGKTHEWYASAQ